MQKLAYRVIHEQISTQSTNIYLLLRTGVRHSDYLFQPCNITSSTIIRRCRSRQIFGGAKDFCQNCPKLAKKKFGPLFVRIFSHDDRFWDDLQKKPLCVILHQLCAIFARIFRDFAKIFTDFCQITTFGGGLAPPPSIPLQYN